MNGWSKIVRVNHGIHQYDKFNNARIVDGTMFNVRFPNGDTKQLPAIVREEFVISINPREFADVERVYFAVPYAGLEQIWIRGIDLDVQPA